MFINIKLHPQTLRHSDAQMLRRSDAQMLRRSDAQTLRHSDNWILSCLCLMNDVYSKALNVHQH